MTVVVVSACAAGSDARTADLFVNPISEVESADPCVVWDGHLGYYYFMRSTGVSITLCRSRRLVDVRKGEARCTAWATNVHDCVRGDIWAPELHRASNGKWYVYASGRMKISAKAESQIGLFVLESRSTDPFDGFAFKSVLDPDRWAIDPTFYEAKDGRMYLAYSTGKKNVGQVLAIRRLANPWTFDGDGVELAQAKEPWELRHPYVPGVWGSILEGPYFLEHDGRLFLVYTANGCWSDDYALGVMELVGGDPMDPTAWRRHADPILVKGNGVFGPGHATFFRSPDGTEVWCAFHATRASNPKHECVPRVLHAQRVHFNAVGLPTIGTCLGSSEQIRPPSGEGRLQQQIVQELAHTIRGGDSYENCWGRRSLWFMYPPVLGFHRHADAVSYAASVKDETGRARMVVSTNASVSLVGVWPELAKGYVTVDCLAKDAEGHEVGEGERRVFWKAAPFAPKARPPELPSYADASRRVHDYLFRRPSVRYMIDHGEPDMSDPMNAYPSKMLGAEISAMTRIAALDPAKRAAALDFAHKAADWIIAASEKADAPLAFFPPTYWGTNLTAKANAGLVMLHYPALVGRAFLDLSAATGETRYLDQAGRIAATYLKLQGTDGTWPLKLELKTGANRAANRLMPCSVIAFLVEYAARTGDAAVKSAADRALGYLRQGPMSDWNWEGQYEDVPPAEKRYDNLTPHFAASLAMALLKADAANAEYRAFARDVARFCEDQFVCWERPFDEGRRFKVEHFRRPGDQENGGRWTHYVQFANWYVPCGLEQYHFYVPIDSATAKIVDLWLALYRAEGKDLDLQKARALGDSIVAMVKPDGRLPTSWQTEDGGDPRYDWPNCMYYTAGTLARLAEIQTSP